VTALASCGALLIAAEGPFLRFYHAKTSRYIASTRIFKAQAVHGICVYAEESEKATKLVVWGGRLARAVHIDALANHQEPKALSLSLSNVVKAPDWILDLAPRMSSLDDGDVYERFICAAVTAHNALLELTVQCQTGVAPKLEMSELTTSSRSILYSAHLLWDTPSCILVAAGTAFGEIMYWSWNKTPQGEATSSIHRVFLGHEGSIFDVRISHGLQRGCCGTLKRVIASCSDDRTIRLWDVSDIDVSGIQDEAVAETQRTRHTGFSVAATDIPSDNLNCLAIGWGHTSRVWKVRFLDSKPCDGSLALLSAGEDATSRSWRLVASSGKMGTLPYVLQQTGCAAYHNGKNMWATAMYSEAPGTVRVACGAADSKLITYALPDANQHGQDKASTVAEYSLQDLLHMAEPSKFVEDINQVSKKSKQLDSIRSFCFIFGRTFLLVTNSGKILRQSFNSGTCLSLQSRLTESILVDQVEHLSNYSICYSVSDLGVAFVAGGKGHIYMYSESDQSLKIIHAVSRKVGSLFATSIVSAGRKQLALLVTLVGQKQAELLVIEADTSSIPEDLSPISIPISDMLAGGVITSMSLVETRLDKVVLILGFRRGTIALYTISRESTDTQVSLFRVIEKVHGDETVTAIKFQVLAEDVSAGYLYSVGRDGCLAVHLLDYVENTVKLVHNLALPIGPNIEDLYFQGSHLIVHGFSSKRWVLYDVTLEEEIMGIETGGAHRSWTFQPYLSPDCTSGGTLLWTRTSSLHIYNQKGTDHDVLRSGGHGREIKAVAARPQTNHSHVLNNSCALIATGAEDTDIRIFQYNQNELLCRATLRKHTTGIQHLQWSDNGEYLFSSAGSEEFYIWRIRTLDAVVDIGVVCEYVYSPESEFSDLRIMSFDVTQSGTSYTIAMVFSDSSIKVGSTLYSQR
jgi:WD40 repeat protein